MAVVNREAPVLDPAIAVDLDGVDGGHAPQLVLVVGQHLALQNEVAHVDEGPPDHAPPAPHHPPLVYHSRRRHPQIRLSPFLLAQPQFSKWRALD
uniref:Uncharacterized protein n=1 Tax=Arundo donax TaxID=35708 RepID=A0A0A9HER2_ARUDO